MSRSRASLDFSMRRLRRVGLAIFGLQLAAMLDWSHVIWSRFSLTDDFAQAWQAWWLLDHGNLNPYDSVAYHHYWQDHSQFLMWPFAILTHFGMDGYVPLAVQDLLVVAAEIVAFLWIVELLRERDFGLPLPNWTLGATSVFLLVANPWVYWAISFDFHPDVMLAAPFFVLAMRALYYRRYRQLTLWTVLVLLSGDVATTYVAVLGVTGLIVSLLPGQRRIGASAAVLAAGVASFFAISHFDTVTTTNSIFKSVAQTGTATGSGPAPTGSALSAGVKLILHPWRVLTGPFHQLRNLWALISPAGLLGLVSLWSLPFALAIAIENTVAGPVFSAIGFQYAAVWAPIVAGGVISARFLARRKWGRHVATVLVVASLLNTIGWAAVWLPKVDKTWVRVDAGAAHVLDEAEHMIPADAEVIASQGVIGRFAARDVVYAFPGNAGDVYPVSRHAVYVILLPYQGIEIAPVNRTLGLLGNLAGPVGAKLVLHGYDVWVFRIDSPTASGTVDLSAGYDTTAVPVWATRSAIGHATFLGPPRDWLMSTSSRRGGYLLYGAYFRKPLGQYILRVRLSTSGAANVEAWNENADVLLGRRITRETNGIQIIEVPVDNSHDYPPKLDHGSFLFKEDPVLPPPGQVIEARVYLPPASTGAVYSVQLIPVSP